MYISTKTKWVATDGWRGYSVPINSVGAANNTGGWSDSPCPAHQCKSEIDGFKKVLRENKIPCRVFVTQTSNVFCIQVHVLVPTQYRERALELSRVYSKMDGIRLFWSND